MCQFKEKIVFKNKIISGWVKRGSNVGCSAYETLNKDECETKFDGKWHYEFKQCGKEITFPKLCVEAGGVYIPGNGGNNGTCKFFNEAVCRKMGGEWDANQGRCENQNGNLYTFQQNNNSHLQTLCETLGHFWVGKDDKGIALQTPYCINKDLFELKRIDDPDFNNWTGLCEEQYNKCTQFIEFNIGYVENGSFEKEDATGKPTGFLGGDGAFVTNQVEKVFGKNSVQIIRADQSTGSSYIVQKVDGLKWGKTYQINVFGFAGEDTTGLPPTSGGTCPVPYTAMLVIPAGWTSEKEFLYVELEGQNKWKKLTIIYETPPSPRSFCSDSLKSCSLGCNAGESCIQSQNAATHPIKIYLFGPEQNGFIVSNWSGNIVNTLTGEPPQRFQSYCPQSYVLYDELEVKEKQNKGYFFIDDDKIDKSSCVREDLKKGCVRFFNTYPDVNSYEIIKVSKDRICANWVMTEKTEVNGNEEIKAIICEEFEQGSNSVCKFKVNQNDINKVLNLSGKSGTVSSVCDSIVPDLNNNNDPDDPVERFLRILCEYRRKDKSWVAGDFSGYSIFGIDNLAKFLNNISQNTDILEVRNGIATTWNVLAGMGSSWTPSAGQCKLYPTMNAPFPSIVKDKEGFGNANVCSAKDPNDSAPEYACECDFKETRVGGETFFFPDEWEMGKCVKNDGTILKVNNEEKWCSSDNDCDTNKDGNPEATCILKRCIDGPYKGNWCKDDNDCGASSGVSAGVQGLKLCQNVLKVSSYKGKWGICLEWDKRITRDGVLSGVDSSPQTSYQCFTWIPFKVCVNGPSSKLGMLCEKDDDCNPDGKCE